MCAPILAKAYNSRQLTIAQTITNCNIEYVENMIPATITGTKYEGQLTGSPPIICGQVHVRKTAETAPYSSSCSNGLADGAAMKALDLLKYQSSTKK